MLANQRFRLRNNIVVYRASGLNVVLLMRLFGLLILHRLDRNGPNQICTWYPFSYVLAYKTKFNADFVNVSQRPYRLTKVHLVNLSYKNSLVFVYFFPNVLFRKIGSVKSIDSCRNVSLYKLQLIDTVKVQM